MGLSMNQWREAQNRCQCEIERLQAADRAYREEGVQLLELARNAQRLFEQRGRRHKIMVPTNCWPCRIAATCW